MGRAREQCAATFGNRNTERPVECQRQDLTDFFASGRERGIELEVPVQVCIFTPSPVAIT